jgi:hypothetical protein
MFGMSSPLRTIQGSSFMTLPDLRLVARSNLRMYSLLFKKRQSQRKSRIKSMLFGVYHMPFLDMTQVRMHLGFALNQMYLAHY